MCLQIHRCQEGTSLKYSPRFITWQDPELVSSIVKLKWGFSKTYKRQHMNGPVFEIPSLFSFVKRKNVGTDDTILLNGLVRDDTLEGRGAGGDGRDRRRVGDVLNKKRKTKGRKLMVTTSIRVPGPSCVGWNTVTTEDSDRNSTSPEMFEEPSTVGYSWFTERGPGVTERNGEVTRQTEPETSGFWMEP